MKILKKFFDKVYMLQSPRFEDDRGVFTKLFNTSSPLGKYDIKQINFVQNHQAGIVRGLHYQSGEHSESKFFRTLKGKINLIYLDIEPSSSTYLQSGSQILDQPNVGLLIPEGFATGYEVLESNTDVLYFSNKEYKPDEENGINWQDPMIKNLWLTKEPVISEKDRKWKIWNL